MNCSSLTPQFCQFGRILVPEVIPERTGFEARFNKKCNSRVPFWMTDDNHRFLKAA
jgi:hypothetical protein